ncbi:MAG TPA: DHHA1 domain-containing protein, partial [Pyrinomonadaceae bacterium]|nr:DHHA1 domain-containing protein [Pyrinomonadaceae bacterium]
TCGSVEAVALLKECSPGVYRTSLRSKGDVNVARIAEKFGGGGHRNAAGCTLSGELEAAEQTIVRLLQDAVEHRNGGGGRDDAPVPASPTRQTEEATA